MLWRQTQERAADIQAQLGVRPSAVIEIAGTLARDWTEALWIEPTGVVAELVLPFLTASFVACGPAQVVLAAPFLVALGRRLESRGGGLAVAVLMLLGGAAAGLAEVAWAPEAELARCGPAGGVSAVVAAYCVLYWRARLVMAVPVVVVPVTYHLPTFAVGLAWLVLQLPAIQRFLSLGACTPTSWVGVVAGLAAGVLFSPLLFGGRAQD